MYQFFRIIASYRIPSIIEAPDKSLLAFCEARKEKSDAGEIALLMKRSGDGGIRWEEEEVVVKDEKKARIPVIPTCAIRMTAGEPGQSL